MIFGQSACELIAAGSGGSDTAVWFPGYTCQGDQACYKVGYTSARIIHVVFSCTKKQACRLVGEDAATAVYIDGCNDVDGACNECHMTTVGDVRIDYSQNQCVPKLV